jgi:hypothetical protein
LSAPINSTAGLGWLAMDCPSVLADCPSKTR